ncbi:hypothetical protein BGZ99_009231 [Dissophora globulifera]|uniref:Protein kinase domain-containing protein n=1 Tax=Dissophora globulifera TaxID=979702 RepID=A0A9P6UZ14_9FUNG|nr:hypothetical protein BGZ99_009231 [Dissophora globulifera]
MHPVVTPPALQSNNQPPPEAPDDDFDSPAFIVQSPTATMSQADTLHPFSFPLLDTPRTTASPSLAAATDDTSTPAMSTVNTTGTTSTVRNAGAAHIDDDRQSKNTSRSSGEDRTDAGTDTRNDGTDDGYHHGRNLSVDNSSASRTASRRSSMQFSKPIEVKETLDAIVTETADGHLQLKQYLLQKIIGQGAYGIVNLGMDVDTGTYYAIKEFSKSKLRKKDRANLFKLGRGPGRGRGGREAPAVVDHSSPLDLIRGEIAILKKLNHVNIVKLYEVLDLATEDSMFMVHEHDIIHRDIKPDNLLRSVDGTIKIVDFGVSEMFSKKGDDLTKKTAGSPAFMAPELCRHDHGEVSGRATDVWSMGVTLYCIRYGRLPFRHWSPLDLQKQIREDEPEDIAEEKDARFKNVMRHLLEKDPSKRITIDELRNDPWLTDNGREPLLCKEANTENAVTEVTEDELRAAIQRINGLVTVFKAISKFKRLIKSSSSQSPSHWSIERDGNNNGDASSSKSDTSVAGFSPLALSPKMRDGNEKPHDVNKGTVLQAPSVKIISDDQLSKAQHLGYQDSSPSAAVVGATIESKVGQQSVPNEAVSRSIETPSKETVALSDAPTVSEQGGDQGDEEYGYCDMETGICYPAKPKPDIQHLKSYTADPGRADAITQSEADNLNSHLRVASIDKEGVKTQDDGSYGYCDMETGVCYPAKAQGTGDAPVEVAGTVQGDTLALSNNDNDQHGESEYGYCDIETGICYPAKNKKDV